MAELVKAAASSSSASAGEGIMTDDQCFLLTVIFGVYFGPHLKGETPPHKSMMQRMVERLPRYTPDQLAGCKMTVAEMMHVYYYILRKASQSVVVAPSLLLKFFRNTLPAKESGPISNYPQFINLFPIDLHPCSFVQEHFMAIDNIVFIDNPSTSYLREEVVVRFKSLTGLREFFLEKDAAKLPIYVTDRAFHEVIGRKACSEGQSPFFVPLRGSHGRKRKSDEALLSHEGSPNSIPSFASREHDTYFKAQLDSKVVFSPLSPGAAVDGGLRRSITGHVSLVESKEFYLFRVSLPGVRRDRTFSFEVDISGEVLIEGQIVTDGKVAESRTEKFCPSGHFSLSFQLPGRVDPKLSNCNFGSDGIFEGVVKKLIANQ